jgi:acyl-coenzyme A thioesterase PaaI-like protein
MRPPIRLNSNIARAVLEFVATVESEIIHPGRRVVHAASVVTDQDGRKLALGDSTLMIVLGKAEPKTKR